jgi:cell division protein FtsW (lipid II flippase)
MKNYFRLLKSILWEKDISILYLIFGLLMFVSAIVQIDDPVGKVEPSIQHPTMVVWTLVIIGFTTIAISPLSHWFIFRNTIMGFCFFLSIYIIVDCGENIIKGANGVWLVALVVYVFLFARSYKDLYADKERYIKPKEQ